MEKVVFLGCNHGISKKSGKDFAFIHLGVPFDQNHGTGYHAEHFFIDMDMYKKVCDVKPISYINADIRFINGASALLGIEV